MSLCIGAAGCSKSTTAATSSSGILSSINISAGDSETVGVAGTFIEMGDSITVNGSGATVKDKQVTITAAGTYSIKGTIAEGQIVVNAGDKDKVYIILNGVNITSSTSAAINVTNANKIVISTAADTKNYIKSTMAAAAADTEPDAAIFSKADLVFTGKGTLVVESTNNKGIAGKDDLKIEGGNITITSAADGIKGKDSVVITDGNIVINAGADGIQSSNDTDADKGYILIEGGTVNITAVEDGLQGEVNTLIKAGNITIKTGGGSGNSSTQETWGQWGQKPPGNATASSATTEEDTASAKAIKAGMNIVIEGGTFNIDSSDDALHSKNNLVISGGAFNIATGDDGIHADSTLTINKGTIDITKAYEGIESQTITIKDGDIKLVASDDGINASGGNDSSSTNGRQGQNSFGSTGDGVININGGNISVNATGDGLDANGSIAMSNGNVVVNGPTNSGNGALDYDGTFEVTGGTLIAAGSSGMAQAPSTSSKQNSVKIALAAQAANTNIRITGADGAEIISVTPSKEFASLVVSSAKLKTGSTYKVYAGSTEVGSFTISTTVSEVTQAGASTGNMGGHGGAPGTPGERKQ